MTKRRFSPPMAMWSRATIVAVIVLSGCATSNERFEGPLDTLTLSAAQIKIVQQGLAKELKEPSVSLGESYRAGTSVLQHQTVVCGVVNGRKFVGKFWSNDSVFIPIMIGGSEAENYVVDRDCRPGGIYLPQS
jgi:hypothetical protein